MKNLANSLMEGLKVNRIFDYANKEMTIVCRPDIWVRDLHETLGIIFLYKK